MEKHQGSNKGPHENYRNRKQISGSLRMGGNGHDYKCAQSSLWCDGKALKLDGGGECTVL